MNPELRDAVEAALGAGRATPRILADRPVSGGCIHETLLLDLDDGRQIFLKADPGAPEDLFEREAEGLAALAAVGALRVPRDARPGRAGETPFLIMEAIAVGARGPRFDEELGRGLAALHRRSRGARYGFDHDNYLGGTPQPNGWCDSWIDFFRDRRLGHQLALARARGRSDPQLDRLGERLLARLEDRLDGGDDPPCLIHGDLWSGNVVADESGSPVLVDPAVHYAVREAELAMTHLFGGFGAQFYEAYEEARPLPAGHQERRPLYQLYHLLNHLNLFGAGYRAGCLAILRRYAA